MVLLLGEIMKPLECRKKTCWKKNTSSSGLWGFTAFYCPTSWSHSGSYMWIDMWLASISSCLHAFSVISDWGQGKNKWLAILLCISLSWSPISDPELLLIMLQLVPNMGHHSTYTRTGSKGLKRPQAKVSHPCAPGLISPIKCFFFLSKTLLQWSYPIGGLTLQWLGNFLGLHSFPYPNWYTYHVATCTTSSLCSQNACSGFQDIPVMKKKSLRVQNQFNFSWFFK